MRVLLLCTSTSCYSRLPFGTPALPFCHVSLAASRPPSRAYPKELKTLGDHLRKRRLDLGLLQKDVARRLGVDTASVTNWEKNHNAPMLRRILRVIEFLGYVPFCGEGKRLGQYMVEMRRALTVHQEDLARQLDDDPSTLGRWERGAGKPLRQHLLKVEGFLNFHLSPEDVREPEQ